MTESSSESRKQRVAQCVSKLAAYPKTGGDVAAKNAILHQLPGLAKRVGVDANEIDHLIDIVLSNTLATSEKRIIVREVMIPRSETIFPIDIIYRILSQIGVPQVYTKDGASKKSKKISPTLQLLLLEWIICYIHCFGENIYAYLYRMLPIMFNYLSYEYSRPYIANLIFLTMVNHSNSFKTLYNKQQNHTIPNVKPWHVQFVVDLYCKFPMDEHLKSLLVLFKSVDPRINYAKYNKNSNVDLTDLGPISAKSFGYPRPELLDNSDEPSWLLQQNLKEYSEFERMVKRRKYRFNDDARLDLLDFDGNANIEDLQSIRHLVLNLYDLRFLKINELFLPNSNGTYRGSTFGADRLKKFFIVAKTIGSSPGAGKEIINKMNYYIRLSLLDDNLTTSELDRLCDGIKDLLTISAGSLDFSSVDDFVFYRYDTTPIQANDNVQLMKLDNLTQRLKLLRFLKPVSFAEFSEFLLPTLDIMGDTSGMALMKSRKKLLLMTFIDELCVLFTKWNCDSSSAANTISKCIPYIYRAYQNNYAYYGDTLDYVMVKTFNVIKSIDIDVLNRNFDDDAVVAPPMAVYTLLLKGDPFLCSEVCGFIAHTKTYDFKSHNYRALQNSYVMDIVNYIWRDKALKYEASPSSPNKAFLFCPELQKNLTSLHIFTYSNMFTLSNVGNFFISPTWAYISSQIVWNLEDQSPNITVRHQGPVSIDSVIRLQSDPDHQWLDTSYDDLRLKVLREIDRLGYKGVADLLFNSLKTLQHLRHSP